MEITDELIERFLLDGLIMQAERALERSRNASYQGRPAVELEELLSKLYDERRAIMEDMMRTPLDRAGRCDA